MFTGIVDHCGLVQDVITYDKNVRLTIKSHFEDLSLGESIAIDGTCLTVTSFTKDQFTVEVSPETMRLTIASSYKPGIKVNLERSLRLMDRLGGHFVTGHIDGLAAVRSVQHHSKFVEMSFKYDAAMQAYLVKKGSIAINGISLTINELTNQAFTVMLIPHTLQQTNITQLQIGDDVNIEFDYLAKLVLNQINSGRV